MAPSIVDRGPLFNEIKCGWSYLESDKHPDYTEDRALVNASLGLFGVFDGVGIHHSKGADADLARNAVEDRVRALTLGLDQDEIADELKNILLDISKEIYERHLGGTTATIAKFIDSETHGHSAVIAHVGDSRAYKIKEDGKIEMVTLDDSSIAPSDDPRAWEVQRQIACAKGLEDIPPSGVTGILSRMAFNRRNEVSQYLGIAGEKAEKKGVVQPHIYIVNLKEGEGLLLTTDGVHDNLTTDEIEEIVGVNRSDPRACSKAMIEAAHARSRDKSHGRHKSDDITSVVVDFEKKPFSSVKPEKKKVVNFLEAQTWDRLYSLIVQQGSVKGSKREYQNHEIADLVNDVRHGRQPIDVLTSALGLRESVMRLLQQDKKIADIRANLNSKK